jgi:hypothetical protein
MTLARKNFGNSESLETVRPGLEALLEQTIEALASLDAGRLESLAEVAGLLASSEAWVALEMPQSAAEWRRAAASHWVLGHLVAATARQLHVQRRIGVFKESSWEYRLDRDTELADRLNSLLAHPWRRGGEHRG